MKGKGFVLRFVGAVDTSSTGRVLKRSPWSPGMTFFREGAVEAGRPSGRCPCGLGGRVFVSAHISRGARHREKSTEWDKGTERAFGLWSPLFHVQRL